jgi:hypothetical protein
VLRVVAIMCLVVACKSRGTITLDFDATFACTGSPAIDHYVLYAEPGLACVTCDCGGCAGAHSGTVLACPGAGSETCTNVTGVNIALPAGAWAVVLEAYGSDGRMLADQCVEITVDEDGVSSEQAVPTVDAGTGSAHGCVACAM